jgi:hypothetical protein
LERTSAQGRRRRLTGSHRYGNGHDKERPAFSTNAARQSIGWRIFGLVANRGLEPARHAPVPEAGKTN